MKDDNVMTDNNFKESEIKHLEMIESVIERMGQNSFALKGWTITLIVAIFAFSVSASERRFALIAGIPIIIFWILDSYYLQQERKYRELYNRAIKHEVTVFSMDISLINENKTEYSKCFFSKTELFLYGSMFIIAIALYIR